jgi:hypothetical protein
MDVILYKKCIKVYHWYVVGAEKVIMECDSIREAVALCHKMGLNIIDTIIDDPILDDLSKLS